MLVHGHDSRGLVALTQYHEFTRHFIHCSLAKDIYESLRKLCKNMPNKKSTSTFRNIFTSRYMCTDLQGAMGKSWRQHPTRHQLYGHLPPITKTIQVRRTRHAGHCWRSKDELISDVLLWTPTYGCAKAGRPARTYIQQLCEDTRCNPEDLTEAMNDWEKWRERVRDIRAGGPTWWWWVNCHPFKLLI